MDSQVKVQSLEALLTLRESVGTFARSLKQGLPSILPPARRMMEALAARRQYWEQKVRKLQGCQQQGDNDGENSAAALALQEAQANLARLRHYEERVQDSWREFASKVRVVQTWTDQGLPRATRYLDDQARELQAYLETR